MISNHRITVVVCVCVVLVMAGCASVPKEAVTLSSAIGQDIEELQAGYKQTVRLSFDQLRREGLRAIDEVWTPAFLAEFIETGKLVESAQHPEFKTELVEAWARLAIAKIDEKRRGFLDPLEAKEDALLADLDTAFDSLLAANATVTAHLNSVVKVKALQEEALERAGLQGIRDKVNDALVDASEFAAKIIDALDPEAGKTAEGG